MSLNEVNHKPRGSFQRTQGVCHMKLININGLFFMYRIYFEDPVTDFEKDPFKLQQSSLELHNNSQYMST